MNTLRLSEDAKAIILLCGIFGEKKIEKNTPLSLSEYNRLAIWLTNHTFRPSDLLVGSALDAMKKEQPKEIDLIRYERLLARGAAMAFALERWTNKGVWVTCRSDTEYPQRLRDHLKMQSPPVLYGIGDRKLIEAGGLAVVGSRNVDQAGSDFTAEVARRAAGDGMGIISGGAGGVDRIAMDAALESGGAVIGVMADSLLKTSLRKEFRQAIQNRQLTLVSPYFPEAGWSLGNAMGRNKYIYALSDYALVVSADYQKGGTWEGAIEELRRDHHVPIFIRIHGDVLRGNRELINKGGLPFPDKPWLKPLPKLLADTVAGQDIDRTPKQMALFK